MDDTMASIPILITAPPFHLSASIRGYLLTRFIRVVYTPLDLDSFSTIVQETILQASQAYTLFAGDRTLPILVVEDADDIREDLATILTLEGYLVDTAHNGVVALDTVSRGEHSRILLDIAMPVMNGLGFVSAYARQLRPHTPVIILSGQTDLAMRVFPPFVVDVLSKPFGVPSLLRLVEKYTQPI